MGIRQHLTDLQLRTVTTAHRALLRLSGGRILASFGSMPVVQLHTTGRKSGQRRTTMLTAPVIDGDRYVLVASKGGDDRNPAWYLNLVANPDVELTIRGRSLPMTARTATAAEKAELWPRIVSAYRGYAGYQRKTERDIPVVICEPR
jgi:deazaflavin-dependent oxidoreductase (nitroreductase family)